MFSLSVCGFPLDLDKGWTQQCRLRTKSLLFRTAAKCIDQKWHKHYQSVQSTVSPSLPPTTGSDCDSTSIQPLVWPFRVRNWTAIRKQCQDCYPEHSGINGENLALLLPQVSHSKLSLQHSAQSELCVFGVGLKSIHVYSSLCYSFRPRYNFVFSVVYTVSEQLSVLLYEMTAWSWKA